MKFFVTLILVPGIYLSTGSALVLAQDEYKQPYPHATGAQLLPYCQQTDIVVDQLRCDYYVQALADLASTPVNGVRLACPPRGTNRTELMEIATKHLASLNAEQLEKNSAASLILQAFQKQFRCPKSAGNKGKKARAGGMEEALKRAAERKAAQQENASQ